MGKSRHSFLRAEKDFDKFESRKKNARRGSHHKVRTHHTPIIPVDEVDGMDTTIPTTEDNK